MQVALQLETAVAGTAAVLQEAADAAAPAATESTSTHTGESESGNNEHSLTNELSKPNNCHIKKIFDSK